MVTVTSTWLRRCDTALGSGPVKGIPSERWFGSLLMLDGGQISDLIGLSDAQMERIKL